MKNKDVDGTFLIRESDSVKGAYVLSTISQQRIHHYRIFIIDDGRYYIQAQQGVTTKYFTCLDELVQYYRQARRGLVCALVVPAGKEPEPIEDDSDDDEEPPNEDQLVSSYLLASLNNLDNSRVETAFYERLKQYLNADVSKDVEKIADSSSPLPYLKELFREDFEGLHNQLDKLLAQVDFVQSLFEMAGGAKQAQETPRRTQSHETSGDFQSLIKKLSSCASAVQGLETTTCQMFKELNTKKPSEGATPSTAVTRSEVQDFNDDEVSFGIRLDSGNALMKNNKTCTVTVKIKEGALAIPTLGSFRHDQVLQLIKSRSKEQRLGVVLSGPGRKDFVFESMQARETFCQLVQLIKNKSMGAGNDGDQDNVSLFVGTWNMGDSSPPSDISSWFKAVGYGSTGIYSLQIAHDMYAIGCQECGWTSEKDMAAKIKNTLKTLHDVDYEKIASQTLWGIRIMIFVKVEHVKKISHIQCAQVKTGIGNALGNKGAVAVSLHFGSVSMCFISAHLTSGNEKCQRRNQNYHDIIRGMSALKNKKLSQFDLTDQFQHMFFFGDLNYRIEHSGPDIVELVKKEDYYAIYSADQLKEEMDKKRVFVGFEEAAILFPPTYRFSKSGRSPDDYVWVKQKRSGIRINVPSYCDRVLWKSYPSSKIINTCYGCTKDLLTSDHSPVFATFQVGGVKQYAPSGPANSLTQDNTYVILSKFRAELETTDKAQFYLEVFSSCFEGGIQTFRCNERFDERLTTTSPLWDSPDPVLKIKPIVTEQGFLESQFMLVMLKSVEGNKPYGECCVPLKSTFGPKPTCVSGDLIHQGLSAGTFEAFIHITLPNYKASENDIYGVVNVEKEDKKDDANSRSRHDSAVEGSKSLDYRPRAPTSAVADRATPKPAPRSFEHSTRVAMPHPPDGRPASPDLNNNRGFSETLPPPPPYSKRQTSNVPSKEIPAVASSRQNVPKAHLEERPLPIPPVQNPLRQKKPPSFDARPYSETHQPPPAYRPPSGMDSGLSSRHFSLESSPPLPARFHHDPPPLRSSDLPPMKQTSAKVETNEVFKLLEQHGLQHFADTLLRNGYDKVAFLGEVSNEELETIGIEQDSDREKLIKVFATVW
eukprot:Em0021g727a